MGELLKILGSAVAGGVAAHCIPAALGRLSEKAAKPLTGAWHSSWQTNSESDKPWSTEMVRVSVARDGCVVLRSMNNDNGYEWEARGRVKHSKYIVGKWKSRLPRSTSCGAFILHITNKGDMLLGFFLGPNRKGSENYGAWVMTTEEAQLQSAKRQLGTMCPTLPDIL